ncbi:oviduct-specific glycoprotein-like [Dreissena polymorpha]|nr:oviduct-specific glycoprotein-like [Dreissena polymorpha]
MDKLDRYVHFVSLMLFDPREVNVTSIRGPLFQDFQNNVGYAESFLAKAGFTKSHICVGLPAYGRTFTLGETTNSSAASAPLQPGIQGNYTLQPGFLSFYEVCRFADTATSTRCRDPYTKEPYITSGNQLIAYEDTESLTYKINWIRDNNFGGASIWGLDLDDFQAMCRSSHQNFPLIRLLEQGLREHIVPPESGDGPCRPNNSSQKSTKTGTVEGNVVTNVTEKTQSLTNKPDFPAKVYKNDAAINNNEIIKSDQASLIASTTVVQKINTRLSILDLRTATGTTNSPISSVNINGKGKASNAKEFNGGTSPTDNNVSLPPSKAVGNPFVGTTTNRGTWGLQSDPVKADNKTSNKDTTSTVASSNQSSNLSFPLIANQVASDQLMPDSDIINNEQPVDATSDQNQVPSVDDTEVVDEDVQGNPGDDLNEDGVDIIE